MREYDSVKDYEPVVLAAAKAAGGIELAAISRAFAAAGITWPVLNPRYEKPSAQANLVDSDILRAWKELGYTS